MTTYPQTITFGEMRRIRRARCVDLLPSVLLRQIGVVAVASLARQIPDPTADDDHIRSRIIDALGKKDWCPNGLGVIVWNGVIKTTAAIVASPMTGFFLALLLMLVVSTASQLRTELIGEAKSE